MLTLLIIIMAFAMPAAAAETCQHTATHLSCVEYVRNYDADTITFNIKGVHPLLGENISIRLAGVDTPEIRTKDPCEKSLAKKAKEFVAAMFARPKRVDLAKVSRGKYFRIVADVLVDGVSVSSQLLAKGYAYPYDGGKKQKVNWCQPLAH